MSILEWIGYAGILLSAIPLGAGILFIVLPISSRFGIFGLSALPITIIVMAIKHYKDIDYGISLVWISSVVMILSIFLVEWF